MLNAELASLSIWLKSNKRSLNTQKMIFHRARIKITNCGDLIIDDTSIARVYTAKYIGIIIDSKLY